MVGEKLSFWRVEGESSVNTHDPVHPMPLENLTDFERALRALDDYPAYKRGEKHLVYHFAIDENDRAALSLPRATKEQAMADLERVLEDYLTAHGVSHTLFI